MAGLREILVSFGIDFDTAPLDKGNAKVEAGIAGLKKFGAALAGAFAVGEVASFVQEQVKLGDELGDQAALLDLSTESLEQWRYAAQFAEISGEELVGMFNKIAKSANSAQDANSSQGKALKELGVNAKDYKTTADVFEVVGEKLAALPEGYHRTALAAQLFGRQAGTKVLQLFKDGAAGIAKYREEFEALGGGMGDFAKQAGEVDDAEKRLNFAWGVAKTRIAGVFLPALEWGLAKLTKFAAAVTKLIDTTHGLGVALGVLGALAAAQAAKILAAYLPVIAPFLLWAAAIAAVILIAEDLWAFFEGRRSLFGRLVDAAFGPGSSDKVRAWAHNVAALVSIVGDIIKAVFSDSTKTIQQRFRALVDFFGGDFKGAAQAVFGEIGGGFVAAMLSAITEVIGLFEGAAEKVLGIFKSIFDFIADGIAKATDAGANDAAKNKAFGQANPDKAPEAADYDTAKKPWYLRAVSAITGIDGAAVAKSIPVPAAGSTGGGSAPGPATTPPVVNNITVPPGTPATLAQRVGAAAHKGTAAALAAPNRAAAAGLGRTAAKT